jgi:malate/lactate dehydrogenase
MFGPNKLVHLVLIELPFAEKAMNGLVMELMDGSYDLVSEISTFTNVQDGFKDIDAAILVGSRPRGPGMERSELLALNGAIFEEQGKALNANAKKTVKVCVVGNPCCTNALVCSANAPDIPSKNFTAMLRLDENRAKSILS